jgi:hypothetical protein
MHEFFMGKVSVNKDGCWIWLKGAKGSGRHFYGLAGARRTVGKRQETTHRLSWLLHNGPIPDGLSVLHKCDVPLCCNPKHLFLGTQQDNIADMHAKGRTAKGYKPRLIDGLPCASKLAPDQVREIRRLLSEGWSCAKLAPHFGVTQANISRIKRGVSWRGV